MVEVWEVSDEGRYSVAGYGTGVIPCSPGQHKMLIQCWRPRSKGWLGRLSEWMLGARPELRYKEVVSSSHDRYGFETESTGTVQVDVGVISKDFELYGVTLRG